MSDGQVILITWGGMLLAFALCFVVAEARFQWVWWRERRGRPAFWAETERMNAERDALRALTDDDRTWLAEMGWHRASRP